MEKQDLSSRIRRGGGGDSIPVIIPEEERIFDDTNPVIRILAM